VLGRGYRIAFGGKGANQAVAAGRAGADIVFLACIGDDAIGLEVRKQLESDGVDVSEVLAVRDTPTGVALIFVNREGENVIAINAGANAALTPEYVAPRRARIEAADALLMQLETPLDSIAAAARAARAAGTKVILNPAPAQALADDVLALVDIITPNETEAEKLTGISVGSDADAGAASAALHAKGIGTVIITLGSRGAWVSENGRGRRVPGFRVRAVDTIAAGDTFNGVMVTALLEGRGLDEAVRFGHAAAAIAVTRAGAQPSVPWRREIDAFLENPSEWETKQ
jgi:ribokinase